MSTNGGAEGIHSENNILHFCAVLCLACSPWRLLGRIWTRIKQVIHPERQLPLGSVGMHCMVLPWPCCSNGSEASLGQHKAPGQLLFRPGYTRRVCLCLFLKGVHLYSSSTSLASLPWTSFFPGELLGCISHHSLKTSEM